MPVVVVMKSPVGIMAGMDAPVTSLQALIDDAKANSGKLTVGNAGLGSMAHLAFEMMQDKTGIKLTGVPYKGGAPMVTDLLGGHLPLAIEPGGQFHPLGPAEEGPDPRLSNFTADARTP